MYTKIVEGNQVRQVFSSSTLPTADEVDDIINESEEIIEEHCEQAWQEKTVTNEYHDFSSAVNRWGSYVDRHGYRIFTVATKKKFPKTFDTAEGDKIEAWSGTEWEDFLVDYNLGEAMYNNDYWIDYELGKVNIFNHFPQTGSRMFRMTYRYGEVTVPFGIRRATTLLAAAMINERYELFLQADKDASPALNQARQWREQAYKIMEDYRINVMEVV